MAAMPDGIRAWLVRSWRSFTGKILILVLTIVLVPLVIYQILEKADREDTLTAIATMQYDGRLIAEALSPLIESADPVDVPAVVEKMKGLARKGLHLQLLVNPAGVSGGAEFELVAAIPAQALVQKAQILSSISEALRSTCSRHTPLAVPLTDIMGEEIILTSLNPIASPTGCWIVAVGQKHHDALNLVFNRPYWAKPEVRAVTAIYLGMVFVPIRLRQVVRPGVASRGSTGGM